MGTAHIVCTHCILGDMDLLPCTTLPALLTRLTQQVFSLTFPRELVTQAPGRAFHRGLLGIGLSFRPHGRGFGARAGIRRHERSVEGGLPAR